MHLLAGYCTCAAYCSVHPRLLRALRLRLCVGARARRTRQCIRAGVHAPVRCVGPGVSYDARGPRIKRVSYDVTDPLAYPQKRKPRCQRRQPPPVSATAATNHRLRPKSKTCCPTRSVALSLHVPSRISGQPKAVRNGQVRNQIGHGPIPSAAPRRAGPTCYDDYHPLALQQKARDSPPPPLHDEAVPVFTR